MVVLNWIKDTLDSGHRLVLKPFKGAFGLQYKQKQQIISEQRALADHYQRCSVQFIEKLEELTEKISSLESGNQQTASLIKQRQQNLFFACLRMETALKSNSELRRERKEWERRLPCTARLDAYHPLVRLELIDSELRVREEKMMLELVDSTKQSAEVQSSSDASKITSTTAVIIEIPKGVTISHGFQESDELAPLSEELVVQRAESLLHEISSQHNNAGSKEEYLEKTQELRDLHKVLRSLQQKNKHQNYRLRLRERMGQLFS